MSVTTLRAQFGLKPDGDPYGDPNKIAATGNVSAAGIYSTYTARWLPRINVLALIWTAPQVFYASIPFAMQGRYIPYSLTQKAGCPGAQVLGLQFGGGQLGVPFAGVSGFAAAIPGAGTAIAGALSMLSSFFTNPCKNVVSQFNAAMCSLSSFLTQLLAYLDQAVGLGQATPAQAAQLWDTYANQATKVLTDGSSSCTPFVTYFTNAILAVGDFSKNQFWPDLYPKVIVITPASPVITTGTPAPANEFAATPATPPATFTPSITNPPNSLKGSPTVAVPIVKYNNPSVFELSGAFGPGTPPAQTLPQGVSATVMPSILTPVLVIGAIIAAAVLL
jgi:hypothetical protein